MKKKVKLVGAIMFIIVMLNACQYHSAYKWKISNQLNTKWVSEDGTIVLNVNDSHLIYGTMVVDGNVLDIYVATEPQAGAGMHIYPLNVLEQEVISAEEKYERWYCSYKTEKEFVATVKDTTFYNVGQEIRFYREDVTYE